MKIKQKNKLSSMLFGILLGYSFNLFAQFPSKKEVVNQMRRVADYQMAQQWSKAKQPNGRLVMGPKTWEAGAFYPGILEVFRQTKDKKYLNHLMQLAKNNNYAHGPDIRNADDLAILQTYLELYEIKKNPLYLNATKDALDSIMMAPKNGTLEYSWCDLLFMGPPVWSRYAKITKDQKYTVYQDKIYFEAVDNLLDKEHHLFYRDDRFKTFKSKNDKLIFWSRGNGWVMAGLARYLEYSPKNNPNRERFEGLLREMATALRPLQQPDGFWKANLLEPQLYPMGETSGTAFFCYAIAWGISNRILDKKEYLPVVEKAWKALSSSILPDGKLGFVQGGGDRPNSSAFDKSNWYSAGGFLMAGRQVYKLL
jgi:unsaturated rhamnogalacturonyl hydrolase